MVDFVMRGLGMMAKPLLAMCVQGCKQRSEILNVHLLFHMPDDIDNMQSQYFSKGLDNIEDIIRYMCNLHNINFNQLIGSLRMKPTSKCCFSVPLCHLLPLHVERSILDVNVQLQENEFVDGYYEGDMVHYVSLWTMQIKWRGSLNLPMNLGMNILCQ